MCKSVAGCWWNIHLILTLTGQGLDSAGLELHLPFKLWAVSLVLAQAKRPGEPFQRSNDLQLNA